MVATKRPSAREPAHSAATDQNLTRAEADVVVHPCEGLTNREIAAQLGKSEFTVKNQVSGILRKLGLPTRARLIALLR